MEEPRALVRAGSREPRGRTCAFGLTDRSTGQRVAYLNTRKWPANQLIRMGNPPRYRPVRLFASTEPRKHLRKPFGTDVEVLADASPQHRRRNVAAAALLLSFVQDVENDPLLAGQPVANVGDPIQRALRRVLAAVPIIVPDIGRLRFIV